MLEVDRVQIFWQVGFGQVKGALYSTNTYVFYVLDTMY